MEAVVYYILALLALTAVGVGEFIARIIAVTLHDIVYHNRVPVY